MSRFLYEYVCVYMYNRKIVTTTTTMKKNRKNGLSIRSDVLNERHYARNNTPTYSQFIGRYHFTDDYGRQYMIAGDNQKVFQNSNVQMSRRTTTTTTKTKTKKCIRNSFGYIKLFVKLPRGYIKEKWFGINDINKTITLKYKRLKGVITPNIDDMTYEVILKSMEKVSYSRATGIVYVKNLDYETCNELLNKD